MEFTETKNELVVGVEAEDESSDLDPLDDAHNTERVVEAWFNGEEYPTDDLLDAAKELVV